jgi:hypothetical protein
VSANFFDNSGVMAGMDFHDFYLLNPVPVIGAAGIPPIKFYPHIVGAPNFWTGVAYLRTSKVTSDGFKMIQKSFQIEFVPHVPMATLANYGLLEYPWILHVIATSSSEATMGVASITGQGRELATCLVGALGINQNCSDLPGMLNAVLNMNTVKTSPTLADYLGWAWTMLKKNILAVLGKWWDKYWDKKWEDQHKDLGVLDKLKEKAKRWMWAVARKLSGDVPAIVEIGGGSCLVLMRPSCAMQARRRGARRVRGAQRGAWACRHVPSGGGSPWPPPEARRRPSEEPWSRRAIA